MAPLKNSRREKFCLSVFEGLSGAAAAERAGYSKKASRQIAYDLLTNTHVKVRLQELRQAAEDATIMSVKERKERLSEIARANLTDFMELGKDGSWVNLGPETPNAGAIQEIHSRTEYDKDGDKPTVCISVKLHDSIRAMSELNRMERVYEEKPGQTTNQIIFVCRNEETKELLEGLMRGERLLPEHGAPEGKPRFEGSTL